MSSTLTLEVFGNTNYSLGGLTQGVEFNSGELLQEDFSYENVAPGILLI
jgi:hypothetical protein